MEEENKTNQTASDPAPAETQNNAAGAPNNAGETPAGSQKPSAADLREKPAENPSAAQENPEWVRKLIYSLCYLWGILFFLPLILYKDDPEAKTHANEGLVLLLFAVVGNVVFGILTVIGGVVGTLFGILASVYSALLLVLGIVGIVFVVTDKKQELPLIGQIKILK